MRYHSGMMPEAPVAFYDDLASDYHLIFADWDRGVAWQADVLNRLIVAELGAEPVSVLDCACGIGTQAIGLALRGHRVHATDISPALVERARREAERLGAPLTCDVADLRSLALQVDGLFDVVLAFDNALPHLLSASEVERAVENMASRVRPDGLLMASIRDYDRILAEPPPGEVPRVLGDETTGQRIVFQLWDWLPDGLIYDLRLFILRHEAGAWQTREFTTRYRALRRDELTEALIGAGLTRIRWLMPHESGYYQPVVLSCKP
jgi:glycine/sarcosine N-methyltransferase